MINHRAVLFFERNEEGTFDLTYSSGDISHRELVKSFWWGHDCQTVQLVEAETSEELEDFIKLSVKYMKDREWLDNYVEPYL